MSLPILFLVNRIETTYITQTNGGLNDDDKLEIIMKTAQSLLEEYPNGWSGDVHEFATASAYVTPDERLWLTSW